MEVYLDNNLTTEIDKNVKNIFYKLNYENIKIIAI